MPGRAEGKPPERPTLGARRHAATAEPPPPHTVRVVPPAVPRAPRAPAKHTDDDPDGTLPPSD
jgi:hypothetical protein